jgi:hypothetical protein
MIEQDVRSRVAALIVSLVVTVCAGCARENGEERAHEDECVVATFGEHGALTEGDVARLRAAFQPPMDRAMAHRLLRERALLALDAGLPLAAAFDDGHVARLGAFMSRFEGQTPRDRLTRASAGLDELGVSLGYAPGACAISE